MKIIKMGHIDIQYICPDCQTIFEVSTDEFKWDEENKEWYVYCPMCEHHKFSFSANGRDDTYTRFMKNGEGN